MWCSEPLFIVSDGSVDVMVHRGSIAFKDPLLIEQAQNLGGHLKKVKRIPLLGH